MGESPQTDTKLVSNAQGISTRSNISIVPKKIGYVGTEEDDGIGKSQIVSAGPEHKNALVGMPLEHGKDDIEFKLDRREF